jgi:hypothetical protein
MADMSRLPLGITLGEDMSCGTRGNVDVTGGRSAVPIHHCTYDQRVRTVPDRMITFIRAISCRW